MRLEQTPSTSPLMRKTVLSTYVTEGTGKDNVIRAIRPTARQGDIVVNVIDNSFARFLKRLSTPVALALLTFVLYLYILTCVLTIGLHFESTAFRTPCYFSFNVSHSPVTIQCSAMLYILLSIFIKLSIPFVSLFFLVVMKVFFTNCVLTCSTLRPQLRLIPSILASTLAISKCLFRCWKLFLATSTSLVSSIFFWHGRPFVRVKTTPFAVSTQSSRGTFRSIGGIEEFGSGWKRLLAARTSSCRCTFWYLNIAWIRTQAYHLRTILFTCDALVTQSIGVPFVGTEKLSRGGKFLQAIFAAFKWYNVRHGRNLTFLSRPGVLAHYLDTPFLPLHYTTNPPVEQVQGVFA